jgi:hypothetical protein
LTEIGLAVAGAAVSATEAEGYMLAAEASATACGGSLASCLAAEGNCQWIWADVSAAQQEIDDLVPVLNASRDAAQRAAATAGTSATTAAESATAAQTAATEAQGFAPQAFMGRLTALEQQVSYLQNLVTEIAAFVHYQPVGPV